MSPEPPVQFLERPDGARLAYRLRPGSLKAPLVLWLGGFMSDMKGTKATTLDMAAARAGWGYLRFDYFAHGESSGALVDGRIGRWLEDSLAVVDGLTQGPLILVGSSMGGWIALLAARARPERIAGLVLIAPAADFTEGHMGLPMSEESRETLARGGVVELPMGYGLPSFPLTRRFLEDGHGHAVLNKPFAFPGPVRVLQGMEDPDVPWRHALKFTESLQSPDLVLTLIKQGDHRLSAPADLARLVGAVEEVLSAIS